MLRIVSIVALCTLLFIGCAKDSDYSYCYSFDPRACKTDPWVDKPTGASVPIPDQELTIKAWLDDQGLKIERVKITEFYHREICDACHVCAEGSRVFIATNKDYTTQLKALDLLNFSKERCSKVF